MNRMKLRIGSKGKPKQWTPGLDRQLAIKIILGQANKGSNHQWSGKRYTRRHLNEAVFRVRQLQLVSDEVLQVAGFNTRRRR